MTTTEQIKARIRTMREGEKSVWYNNYIENGLIDLVEKLIEEQEGMVLVPVEPTLEMVIAGTEAAEAYKNENPLFFGSYAGIKIAYKAMTQKDRD